MRNHTFVIAEAGVNHNGDLGRALELVDVAVDAGADAVKFQTFKSDLLATSRARLCRYQATALEHDNAQREMLRELELKPRQFEALAQHCASRGIEFMSTAFDPVSLEFLVRDLGVRRIKIPSGELVNPLLLLPAARSGLPVILSTGLANLTEVLTALDVLAFGFVEAERFPTRRDLEQSDTTSLGRSGLAQKVTVLQCVTEYPVRPEDANLRAMATLRQESDCAVGLSDHTEGTAVSIAAIALGASIIEKHITTDTTLPGPDHKASLGPDEFARLVEGIRIVELALGDGVKAPNKVELGNREAIRGSVVAGIPIRAGDTLSDANIAVKRPGDGLPPMTILDLIGTPASRDFEADEQLER